jgi:hypothetical protein
MPAVWHSVTCIDREIKDCELEFGRIDGCGPEAMHKVRLEGNVGAHGAAEKRRNFGEPLRKLDGLRLQHLLAGERE